MIDVGRAGDGGSILLLRPGAIGDTLLTVPALVALRRQFPDAAIHVVGNAVAAPLIAGQRDSHGRPLVDRWTPFDDPAVTGLFVDGGPTHLAERTFGRVGMAVDWCADPEGLLGANLGRLGAGRVVVAPSRPSSDLGIHVADHLLATLGPFGVQQAHAHADGDSAPLAVLPEWERGIEATSEYRGILAEPFVLLHPGSGSPTKNWPLDRFARVAEALPRTLGATAVVVLGPAEGSREAEVRAAFGPLIPVLLDVPLTALAAIMRRARAYLGNDSGLTHLAGMLGVPTVALFGPTDPAMWAPLGPRVTVLRRKPLDSLRVDEVVTELSRLPR